MDEAMRPCESLRGSLSTDVPDALTQCGTADPEHLPYTGTAADGASNTIGMEYWQADW